MVHCLLSLPFAVVCQMLRFKIVLPFVAVYTRGPALLGPPPWASPPYNLNNSDTSIRVLPTSVNNNNRGCLMDHPPLDLFIRIEISLRMSKAQDKCIHPPW